MPVVKIAVRMYYICKKIKKNKKNNCAEKKMGV